MKRWASVLLALTLTALCVAQSDPLVPAEVLARIKDDDPNPLPRHMTPAERRIPLPLSVWDGRDPPTGLVYTPAEYEPNEGLFVRWGSYNAILTQLVVGVTTGDPEAIAYVVVYSASQQASATSTLQSAGANLEQVEFILYETNTVWIRDYGPRFIFEDNQRAIIDHTYNRPRPKDNGFPAFIGQLWNEEVYLIPLTHGGGNYHLFANREAFMTDLILKENPGLSAQQVKDYFRDYQNVTLTVYEGFPTSFDHTQHIDMWMLPVGNDKVIIGKYASSTGKPHAITENAVADLTARGYTVYRTPGWNSWGTHYTYTNAVILNDQVFVPSYGGSYAAQDAEALAVFQQAMPEHDVYQVNCASIIGAAGALHCIMMHVPTDTAGDLNCDGEVNFDDIDPFVLALSGPQAYYAQYPDCRYENADCDRDGDVDLDDVDPFVALLAG